MKLLQKMTLIAFRNIFRNKRRALLTISIITLGCTGLITIGGFFENLMAGFAEVFIHSQTGHLQINAKGFDTNGSRAPLDYLISEVAATEEMLLSHPEVSYVVPRLKFQGMASSGETSIAVLALGVDPILERKMGNFQTSRENLPSTNIVQGSDLQENDPYGVVVGRGLMNSLGLKVGDGLSFLTTRKAGALDGAELHIRGVFETFVKDFDDRSMKMNLKTAQKILGAENQIQSFLVLLKETRKTDAAKADLQKTFAARKAPLEVFSWVEQGAYYRQSKDLLRQIFLTIQAIICVIFFFSVSNTTNMVVCERMREFGTMMAIGNGRWTIFGMIFLETAAMALIGTAIGLIVATGVSELISLVGIPTRPPQANGVYVCTISLTPKIYLQTFAISMFSTLFSAIIPGIRAAHFKIVQALGYV